ncbi:MAG: ribonuclease HI [Desulfovibrionaceae bacterium]|nr:ribonuclease HI [Desulfovibrionaceae bacterium]
MLKDITIYTDGSCRGNPGRGGWAAVILDADSEKRIELSGGYKLTTNNRMEIMSIIKALDILNEPANIKLHSDSEYVCNAFNKRWLQSWQKNNWCKANKEPVKNVDLWKLLLEKIHPHKIKFVWVRGHAGTQENERCDQLAQAAASRADLPCDTGFAKKWA